MERHPRELLETYDNVVGDLVTKSCLTLATPWTGARQASLSMGFSRQEYWSELHLRRCTEQFLHSA